MDNQAGLAPDGGVAESSISVVNTNSSEPISSVSAAARALRQARTEKLKETTSPAAINAAVRASAEQPQEDGAPPAAEPATESTSQEGDAAPPEQEATGETEVADPAAKPPIEPPRSWSADARERWSKLDPDTQQYLLERDRTDSAAIRKAQNEAAEKLKGLTAKEQAVEQARQQYDSALPILMSNLQAAMQGEFSDIKSMTDVTRMATEDWPRYVKWDAQQKQVAAVQQELRASQERQAQELSQKWNEFAKSEDDTFTQKVPEMADRTKAAAMQTAAVAMLKDIGFTEDDLGKMWSGQQGLSLRDHRVQLLVLDGIRYREAQQKAKQTVAKPLPPVQRPGVSQPRGAANDAQVQALNQRLEKSGSLKDAAALLKARRAAAR